MDDVILTDTVSPASKYCGIDCLERMWTGVYVLGPLQPPRLSWYLQERMTNLYEKRLIYLVKVMLHL